MRYFCTDCSYIYDESLGQSDMGINSGTKLEDIPDFSCPGCEAQSDMFQPIIEEVLYAESSNHLSDIEREHIPHILHADSREVEVSAGEDIHPSGGDHRITYMSLHDEQGDMVEEYFFDIDEDPICVFHVEDLDNFEIRASCSEHGVWSTGMIENQGI